MIPADYLCEVCGARGVKLWREYNIFTDHNTLTCGACTEKASGKAIDLSVGERCGWRVPAVPTLEPDAPWWGYTSVPPEGCAWWKALPLALVGEWKVRGGKHVWMPYRSAVDAVMRDGAEIIRVDMHREGGAVGLVFFGDHQKWNQKGGAK